MPSISFGNYSKPTSFQFSLRGTQNYSSFSNLLRQPYTAPIKKYEPVYQSKTQLVSITSKYSTSSPVRIEVSGGLSKQPPPVQKPNYIGLSAAAVRGYPIDYRSQSTNYYNNITDSKQGGVFNLTPVTHSEWGNTSNFLVMDKHAAVAKANSTRAGTGALGTNSYKPNPNFHSTEATQLHSSTYKGEVTSRSVSANEIFDYGRTSNSTYGRNDVSYSSMVNPREMSGISRSPLYSTSTTDKSGIYSFSTVIENEASPWNTSGAYGFRGPGSTYVPPTDIYANVATSGSKSITPTGRFPLPADERDIARDGVADSAVIGYYGPYNLYRYDMGGNQSKRKGGGVDYPYNVSAQTPYGASYLSGAIDAAQYFGAQIRDYTVNDRDEIGLAAEALRLSQSGRVSGSFNV